MFFRPEPPAVGRRQRRRDGAVVGARAGRAVALDLADRRGELDVDGLRLRRLGVAHVVGGAVADRGRLVELDRARVDGAGAGGQRAVERVADLVDAGAARVGRRQRHVSAVVEARGAGCAVARDLGDGVLRVDVRRRRTVDHHVLHRLHLGAHARLARLEPVEQRVEVRRVHPRIGAVRIHPNRADVVEDEVEPAVADLLRVHDPVLDFEQGVVDVDAAPGADDVGVVRGDRLGLGLAEAADAADTAARGVAALLDLRLGDGVVVAERDRRSCCPRRSG